MTIMSQYKIIIIIIKLWSLISLHVLYAKYFVLMIMG